MPPNRTDQFERDQALAERYRPLLILYPEISSEIRKERLKGKEKDGPPACEDYWPRDVRLVLDHACRRFHRTPHDGEKLLADLEKNPKTDRIDILDRVYSGNGNEFWASYYRIVNKTKGHERDKEYPCTAYVHVVYGDDVTGETAPGEGAPDYRGLIAIDYWFIYLYNHWVSLHEGDWEHILVILKEAADPRGQPEPIGCAYSVHDIGYRRPWREVEKVDDQGERAHEGTHPVVYVANGSHANYFFGPWHYHTKAEALGVRVRTEKFPLTKQFTDYTTSFEHGKPVIPELRVVPPPVDGRWEGEWRWLNFSGRWGSPGPGLLALLPRRLQIWCLRRIQKAPESLPPRDNWGNPFKWVDCTCEDAQLVGMWLARQSRLA